MEEKAPDEVEMAEKKA